MNSNKLVALRDAIDALLNDEAPVSAPIVPPVVPPIAPAAPAAPAESIWTADKIVRWVDRGAGARNARGARIVDGAQDPLGLLAVAAANPGRPVYSTEYPKTGRQADGLVVTGTAGVRAKRTGTAPAAQTMGGTPVAPPAAPAGTKPLATLSADLMAQWVASYPEAANVLARILGTGIATRQYTYRDLLALGGIVPARTAK